MENFDLLPDDNDVTAERNNPKAEKGKEKAKKVEDLQNSILAYLHDLVFLLAALLLLFVMLFRIVVVSGDSMLYTLHEGDYLIVLSSSVYKNPKQGDVVVISKDVYKDGEPLVKRVIATEGQTVRIEGGYVYVDDVRLEGEETNPLYEVDFPITVPEGHVFVLGDNRDNSKDSRSSEIGMIDEREILGKVLVIALPAPENNGKRDFSRFGAV